MYPSLYYAFKDLFGINLPFLKAIHTVGFFIAFAFAPGAWLWAHELKRKEKNGELTYITKTITGNTSVSYTRIIFHFVLGFVAAYKLAGLFLSQQPENAQAYLFSFKGNMLAGLLCGLTWGSLTFYNEHKNKLANTQQQTIQISPHQYVPHAIFIAAIAGIIGSKLFGILEDWHGFMQSPMQSLQSPDGFNFLGGLILATFAMWFYHYRFGLQRMRMADALTPSLMLSYAIGRLGCQIAGDGDWGISNPNPKPVSWLPDWLWAYVYPHNVIQKGIYIQGCTLDEYCNKLPVPVYPTPLYETIMCLMLCGLLLFAGRRLKLAGQLSGLYLVLVGVERFSIEQIRVNIKYTYLGLHFTQAEALSILLFVCGVILFAIAPKLPANKKFYKDQDAEKLMALKNK